MTAEDGRRARVELEIDDRGMGSCRIDGLEVAPAVSRVVIAAAAGDLPRVELWIVPGSLAIDVDGSLTIRLDEDDDPSVVRP